MRAPERFEHTEPWGFTPEGSGVRTRPDLELLASAKAHRETQELDETPPTRPSSKLTTALLPPARPTSNVSTAVLSPLRPSSPPPRPSTQSITRPMAAPSRPSRPSLLVPAAASPAGSLDAAPLQAAVHASVYASVQAIMLAASQMPPSLPRPSALPPPASLLPAPASDGWSAAQRIYVLATAVALSVMATTIVFLTLGAGDVHGTTSAPRTARAAAVRVAALDTSSAARKEATAEAAPLPARRAFAPTSSAPRSSGALSTNAGGTSSPGAGPSATKLDDAARSARMLREQLNTAVN
ncbi:MAG TPA: hypothetical protein VLT33_35065 [Labilithrix sp.]|nr:hypothetical protein [Labilithrix sp.]